MFETWDYFANVAEAKLKEEIKRGIFADNADMVARKAALGQWVMDNRLQQFYKRGWKIVRKEFIKI